MKKIFLRGLIATAPLVITIALFAWLFSVLENVFGKLIRAIIGDQYYFKGLGIIVALILIFFIGIIINNWVIKKIYDFGDKIFHRIPFIKTIYSSIKELLMFFHGENRLKQSHVVAVEIAGLRLVGLVTRDTFQDLPEGIAVEGDVAVYLPMSYQIGGYTVMLPRSKLTKIEMSFEESMRFLISAGILGKKK
jgi:uncharacterized membrane protein